MKQKPIVFYTSDASKERIRVEAKARNLSISSFVNLCVHDWLYEHSKKPAATPTQDVNPFDINRDMEREQRLYGCNSYQKHNDTNDSL